MYILEETFLTMTLLNASSKSSHDIGSIFRQILFENV